MRHALIIIFLVAVGVAAADDPRVAAPLEAKGVKLRKLKDGTVTELSAGGEVTLSLDDYRLIGKLTKLQRVNLGARNLPLQDNTLAAIGALPNVEHFFANASRFTDDGLKGFAGWQNLRHFGFDHWFGPEGAKDYVGAGLVHLAALPKLQSVRLGGCRVDNRATAALAKVKTLQKIDLFHTFAVTDDGMPALQALPDLRVIKLGPQYTPRITDQTLRHLSAIPTLEEIHITETWLTYDGGFVHLKKLPKLQLVSIPNVVADPADIARLKSDLPNTKVVWNLPDEANTARTRQAFERARSQKK